MLKKHNRFNNRSLKAFMYAGISLMLLMLTEQALLAMPPRKDLAATVSQDVGSTSVVAQTTHTQKDSEQTFSAQPIPPKHAAQTDEQAAKACAPSEEVEADHPLKELFLNEALRPLFLQHMPLRAKLALYATCPFFWSLEPFDPQVAQLMHTYRALRMVNVLHGSVLNAVDVLVQHEQHEARLEKLRQHTLDAESLHQQKADVAGAVEGARDIPMGPWETIREKLKKRGMRHVRYVNGSISVNASTFEKTIVFPLTGAEHVWCKEAKTMVTRDLPDAHAPQAQDFLRVPLHTEYQRVRDIEDHIEADLIQKIGWQVLRTARVRAYMLLAQSGGFCPTEMGITYMCINVDKDVMRMLASLWFDEGGYERHAMCSLAFGSSLVSNQDGLWLAPYNMLEGNLTLRAIPGFVPGKDPFADKQYANQLDGTACGRLHGAADKAKFYHHVMRVSLPPACGALFDTLTQAMETRLVAQLCPHVGLEPEMLIPLTIDVVPFLTPTSLKSESVNRTPLNAETLKGLQDVQRFLDTSFVGLFSACVIYGASPLNTTAPAHNQVDHNKCQGPNFPDPVAYPYCRLCDVTLRAWDMWKQQEESSDQATQGTANDDAGHQLFTRVLHRLALYGVMLQGHYHFIPHHHFAEPDPFSSRAKAYSRMMRVSLEKTCRNLLLQELPTLLQLLHKPSVRQALRMAADSLIKQEAESA